MAALIQTAGATGSGSMTIQGPNTNSTQVVSVPDSSGTMMVSGNMPAFSAYQSSAQTLTTGTATLLQFQTKEFDTASAFNNTGSTVGSAPAYSFNPQVAGYYQLNTGFAVASTATSLIIYFYKNGTTYKQTNNPTTAGSIAGSILVYLNGSTDYVQVYGYMGLGQNVYAANASYTFFQASLVRAA